LRTVIKLDDGWWKDGQAKTPVPAKIDLPGGAYFSMGRKSDLYKRTTEESPRLNSSELSTSFKGNASKKRTITQTLCAEHLHVRGNANG
jgi:hypothetical protein